MAECHSLDRQLAEALSKEWRPDLKNTTKGFRLCVRRLQKARGQQLNPDLKNIESFEKTEGPVVVAVNKVLEKYKITPQAYHGGAFNGNHCSKYLKYKVIKEITLALEQRAYNPTEDSNVHKHATAIGKKYLKLNTLYFRVHRLLSHTKPVRLRDIPHMKNAISEYMSSYRGYFSMEKDVTPKQHILEAHCLPWMERWGLGLGIHGEQGIEEMHAEINRLKRRAWAMKNKGQQLCLLMKEQQTNASPVLLDTPIKKKKNT